MTDRSAPAAAAPRDAVFEQDGICSFQGRGWELIIGQIADLSRERTCDAAPEARKAGDLR